MKLLILVPLAAFLSFVAAEDVSPCLSQCIDEAALVAGCISSIDYACTCTSPAFRAAMTTCMADACTKADEQDLADDDALCGFD